MVWHEQSWCDISFGIAHLHSGLPQVLGCEDLLWVATRLLLSISLLLKTLLTAWDGSLLSFLRQLWIPRLLGFHFIFGQRGFGDFKDCVISYFLVVHSSKHLCVTGGDDQRKNLDSEPIKFWFTNENLAFNDFWVIFGSHTQLKLLLATIFGVDGAKILFPAAWTFCRFV